MRDIGQLTESNSHFFSELKKTWLHTNGSFLAKRYESERNIFTM